MDKKVWLITGASRGLGLALIKQLLAEGHRVAAASKYLPELVASVSKTPDAGFLPLVFDAADDTALARSIRTTWEVFGRIDTVVINAGFGAADPLETTAVIRNVLPWFRIQGSGHIIRIDASRLPVQYTRYENIYITTVVTGANQLLAGRDPAVFRGASGEHAAGTMTIPIDGKQIGDPRKAAEAILQIAAIPAPPTRVFLASNASNLATEKMAGLHAAIKSREARMSRSLQSTCCGQS